MSESVSESKDREFALPKRSYGTEFWVGLFAIAGMLSFTYLSVNIASMKFSRAGYYMVESRFNNVAGLKVGSSVEIAGVRIGQVGAVRLDGVDALVTLEIRDGIPLRDDDIAQIRTKGIIGDKYIKIAPGGSEDLIAADGTGLLIDTESAVEFEDILGKFIHSLDDDGKDE